MEVCAVSLVGIRLSREPLSNLSCFYVKSRTSNTGRASSFVDLCPFKRFFTRGYPRRREMSDQSSTPPLSPRHDLLSNVRTLNNLLTTKLHGDHRLFPDEQALNNAIRAQVKWLRYHRNLNLIANSTGGESILRVKRCLWWLQNMVSEWRDNRAMNAREIVQLVKLRTELEDVQGWKMAINRAWDAVG